MRYTYPAIFLEEKDGGYSVTFPDLEGCYTCGDDLGEAIYMAQDVLAFALFDYEKNGKDIPTPSVGSKLRVKKNEFVNYISCDTLEYQRRNNSKAVKKTLTIPEYLDAAATTAGINFSQTLQDALKEKLHFA